MLYKKYNLTFSLPDGGQKVVPFNIPVADAKADEISCIGWSKQRIVKSYSKTVSFSGGAYYDTIVFDLTSELDSNEQIYAWNIIYMNNADAKYFTQTSNTGKILTITYEEPAIGGQPKALSGKFAIICTARDQKTSIQDMIDYLIEGGSCVEQNWSQSQTLKFTLADNTTKEISFDVPIAEPTALNIPCEGWGTKLFSYKQITIVPGSSKDVSCPMDIEDHIIRPIVGWKIINFTSTSSAASLDYFSAYTEEEDVDMGDGAIEAYENLVIEYLDPNGTSPYTITFDVELIHGLKSYSSDGQTIYQTNVQDTLDWLATNKDFNRF